MKPTFLYWQMHQGNTGQLSDKLEFALNKPSNEILSQDKIKEFDAGDIWLHYSYLFTELTPKRCAF